MICDLYQTNTSLWGPRSLGLAQMKKESDTTVTLDEGFR